MPICHRHKPSLSAICKRWFDVAALATMPNAPRSHIPRGPATLPAHGNYLQGYSYSSIFYPCRLKRGGPGLQVGMQELYIGLF